MCSIYKMNWARRTFALMIESALGSCCILMQFRGDLKQPWGCSELPILCPVYSTRSWKARGGNTILLLLHEQVFFLELSHLQTSHLHGSRDDGTGPVVFTSSEGLPDLANPPFPCLNSWQKGGGGLEERDSFSLTASECKWCKYSIN